MRSTWVNKVAELLKEGDTCFIRAGIYRETVVPNSNSMNVTLDRLRVKYNSHYVTIPPGNSIGAHNNETGVRLAGSNRS